MRIIEVIPAKRWRNLQTGQTASIHGAVPYVSDSDKANWQLETIGYTWLRADGRVGLGCQPAKTRREAQKIMRETNQKYQERMSIWNAAKAR